ncbi:MAG: DUF2271 domain-containing protein [Planctomycetota bacterium]|jgi:hypothetical protein|nr:DUF2271 domain-containing protein [Planctomycetota bacterium]
MKGKAKAFVLTAAVGALAAWRFVLAGSAAPELDQSIDQARARVELSFDYASQGGRASNQIAAWVTDKDGNLVKTLFATSFTAGREGWKSRKESLPQWVADSGAARLGKPQVDAISRATPASGAIRCAWYCDDANGKSVPAGLYILNLEGSLRWENRVLHRATVLIGGEGREERPEPAFFGPSTAERGMLTNVVVRHRP